MIIAVDFDGTCVEHMYPDIGPDVPGAVDALHNMAKECKIILWTMRSGNTLSRAVEWFKDNGIELYGVNENPNQKKWTKSPKAYASIYIDDSAFGCPLTTGIHGDMPMVDWDKVGAWWRSIVSQTSL